MKIFMFIGFLINIMFLNFNNPLILGILMMIQTLNLILLMGKIYYSFWFAYIIFLVFIGGLFILFVYMITLIYNNKYYYKFNFYSYLLIFLSLLIINKYFWFYNNNENNLITNCLNNDLTLNLLKLYNFPNNFINLLLINYLLLLMIIIVKITNFSKGPMKSL